MSPACGPIERHEQLHERRLPGSGRSDKRHGLTDIHMEGNAVERIGRSRLMPERHVVELDAIQRTRQHGMFGPRLLLHCRMSPKFFSETSRLAIDVDDVAEFLQRTEDEERIEPQRHELADD